MTEVNLSPISGGYDAPENAAPAVDTAFFDENVVFEGEDVTVPDSSFTEQPAEAAGEQPPASSNLSPEMAAILQQNQELLRSNFEQARATDAVRLAELEARLQAYENSNTAPQKQWYEDLQLTEVSEEQQEPYKAAMPVIESIAERKALEIAKHLVSQYIDPMRVGIEQSLQPLHENLTVTQHHATEAQKQVFKDRVNARLPWLTPDVLNSRAYAEYYNAAIPGTGGITRAALVEQAVQAGNSDAVVELLSGFQTPQSKAANHIAPGRSYATDTTSASAAAPRKGMRLSTYNNALKAYSQGQMSPAKFSQYEQAWSNALANGTAVVDE